MSDKPDLSPYKLLIATPAMDGKFECIYKDSLFYTEKALTECGAVVHQVQARYCADVYVARAKLLGHFIRDKSFTHFMFIDADQGWFANDVSRMLLLNRDFIAAAGPKKQYPLTYAFHNVDDYSNQLPLDHELETRVAEVSEVGGAFVMISRNCVEKMVEAFPELAFNSEKDLIDYALFDPIIINKGSEYPIRRLSEDYSFCYRWRQIGGKVEVLMDVVLSHVGSHTFTGSLYEKIKLENPDFDKPE